MFIDSLVISDKTATIRELNFRQGLNLIIDDTPSSDDRTITGNNVGKTTILKLINFCLGGEGKDIYTDEENKGKRYEEIKAFLEDNEVLITLTLVSSSKEFSTRKSVVIERNFLNGKKNIRRINGKQIQKKEFEKTLCSTLFPNNENDKPTFRQIISHNIRYHDDSLNKTLKTLSPYTSDVEYESLYLYLLGCGVDSGARKQILTNEIKQEHSYMDRLQKKEKRNSYEVALNLINDEIQDLNRKKNSLNINEDFERDLDDLNEIRYKINRKSSSITRLELRRDMINEAKNEMEKEISVIDMDQLEMLYKEAKAFVPSLQKSFEDLVNYHNRMIVEKISFIARDLPAIEEDISKEKTILRGLLDDEVKLSAKIKKSDSFEDLEKIISQLNEKYRMKGEYEGILEKIDEAEASLKSLEEELRGIDEYLYSDDFQKRLKQQINKFNKHFASVSNELYGERYALTYNIEKNKRTGKPVYVFSTFNSNMSSGKKQGEILCFDLAYTLFADDESLPCLHFLLNDKKELMHGNQLTKISEFIEYKNVQLIISILKDKLPREVINRANIVVELSQNDKLFRI